MIQFFRSLRHRLSHTHQSLHILCRSTSLSPNELESITASRFTFHVSLHWITTPNDPHFPHLVQIQAEQGLDESWCLEQLQSGSAATVATVEQDGKTIPAGVGMFTRNEFFVGQIDSLYHPGPA